MFKEFREFAAKGNVVDLAVGVIIGAAFGKIVTTLVEVRGAHVEGECGPSGRAAPEGSAGRRCFAPPASA